MHTPRTGVVRTEGADVSDAPAKLQAVPHPDSVEYEAFVAGLLDDEELACTPEGSAIEWESLSQIDEKLLALGFPIAFSAGDDLPDVEDESDMDPSTVTDIRVGLLHRCLREMPALQSKVMRLSWGIGCDRPLAQAEVARRTGLSQASVSRALVDGMAELRLRFGVTPPEVAA